jgi:hypothetical protein
MKGYFVGYDNPNLEFVSFRCCLLRGLFLLPVLDRGWRCVFLGNCRQRDDRSHACWFVLFEAVTIHFVSR